VWKLFVLFTVVPAVEIFLLLQMGSFFGPMPTFLFVLGTGILGAWLAKREGFAVLRQLQSDLAKGLPPAARLVEGALVLIGGLLLITPGVLTDLTGIVLLIPAVRRALAPRIVARYGGSFAVAAPTAAAPAPGHNPFASKFDA
jgi:UPF0716 protein FxsA